MVSKTAANTANRDIFWIMKNVFKQLWRILPVCLLAFSFAAPAVLASDNVEKADLVVIQKSRRQLELWSNGATIARYHVALGFNPIGAKQEEGDGKTPEGVYTVVSRNAKSNYFRALKINYPNATDEMNAAAKGEKPGGLIMIHGLPNDRTADMVGHPNKDWTNGCIAVNDEEILDIWRRVDDGTAVLIMP